MKTIIGILVLFMLVNSVFGFELLPREEIPQDWDYEEYVQDQIAIEASMISFSRELMKVYRSYFPIGISCRYNPSMEEFQEMVTSKDYAFQIRSDIDELYDYCIENKGLEYPGNPLSKELAQCAVSLANKFNIDPTTPVDGFAFDYRIFIGECMLREDYVKRNHDEILKKIGEDGMDRMMKARDKFFLKQIKRPKPCANGSCPQFKQVAQCNDEDGDCSDIKPTTQEHDLPKDTTPVNKPVISPPEKVTPKEHVDIPKEKSEQPVDNAKEKSEQDVQPLIENHAEPIAEEIPNENFLVRFFKKFFGAFA